MAITVLRTKSAKIHHNADVETAYARVKFSTPMIDTAAKVCIGAYPQNSMPMETVVRINTTFDKDLIIGTSAAASAIATSVDIVRGTTDTYVVDRAYGTIGTTAGDVPIYVQLSSTGATVGEADIWVRYMPAQ